MPPRRAAREPFWWVTPSTDRRILDIGTGTGALIPDILSLAPTARIIGIDPSLGMLAHATAARVPLVAMDAMALGVRPGMFDIVLAFRKGGRD